MKTNTLTKLPSEDRGRTELAWLHSRHSFSFGEYFDVDRRGFRALRVLNDDIVEPGMGFGMHSHHDAEIFSYVIEGQLQHKDSMGNGSVIHAGDLQYLSAGGGLQHSEFNPSRTVPVRFLQIWLTPKIRGGEPRYAQKSLGSAALPNTLTLLFSGDGRDDSVAIRQDAEISFGRLDEGRTLEKIFADNAAVYIHMIKGDLQVGGEALRPGDGAAFEDVKELLFASESASEFLVVDFN